MLQRYAGPTPVDLPTLDPPLRCAPGDEIDHPELLTGFEPVEPDQVPADTGDGTEPRGDGPDVAEVPAPPAPVTDAAPVPAPVDVPAPVVAAPPAPVPAAPVSAAAFGVVIPPAPLPGATTSVQEA